MKHLLMKALLCLSSLLYISSSIFAQNNYLKANSVDGITVYEHGSGLLYGQEHTENSVNTTSEILWFKSPSGVDPGTGNRFQAGMMNVSLTNTTTAWRKVSLYDITGTAIIRTQNIAPNQVIYWGFNTNAGEEDKRLDAAKTYYWKIETIASQTVSCVNDAINAQASNFTYINVLDNDINIPSGADCRLKSGQSLVNITVTKDQYTGLRVVTGATQGNYSFVYEVVSSTGTVLGEATATITVIAASQYCTLSILSNAKKSNSNTVYEFVMYSPNPQINPYDYEIHAGSYTGTVVKRGTTPIATSNKETIDFSGLATGTYYIKFSSTVSTCYDFETVEFISENDICVLNATAVKSLNNYVITIPVISGVTNYDYVFTNANDSVITKGITSGNTLTISFVGKRTGEYHVTLKPNNSTKICSQNLIIKWITSLGDNRGYLKKYNNVPDYYEMAGLGDYGGTKDAGTGWVVKETRNVMYWQTYVKALSSSVGAKALITFRQDSSSTSKHYSLSFEKGKIKIISRTTKGGQNIISNETIVILESGWLRFERNGNNLIVKISDSPPESDTPIFSTITTINNAFVGWTLPFWKGLYISSGSSTTLASAEFHRFLGGPYTGTTIIADNTPVTAPVIVASNLNPTANSSVTFTSNACKSGYLIQFYKNGLPSFQGSTYAVTAAYGDYYKAKCEKGTDKSAFSNTITFTAPSTTQICGITDGLKIGTKTRSGVAYELFARIFSGKLWLTQSLGTTPESFLVRGVNITTNDPNNPDFAKNWSGTDYSCFEGQNTGYGGNVEPTGFTTPTGYRLNITSDGAKIYTFGTVNNATNSNVNVIVFVGESNAGSRNQSSTLTTGESGIRAGVRILNNTTNKLEQLNVGTNNYLGENDAIVGGWGWEVPLANLRASGAIANDFIIVKTAQGGAKIGEYNIDIENGYYATLSARISAVKNLLIAEGKTPIFQVMYSQGINNATTDGQALSDPSHYPNQSGITYWQSATTTMLANLRTLLGANTKISMMKFFGNYGTYLNGAIDNIVNSNALNSSVNTGDLTIQSDGLHISASGTRTVVDRYTTALGLITTVTPPSEGSSSITEPAKSQYFFSNGQAPSYYSNTANLPAIFTNTTSYDAVNDFVWLRSDKIKIGLNLKRGGQIAWASLINDSANLIYNGYDGGFQVQLDAYQKRDGYVQNGKYSRAQYDAQYQYNNNTTAPAPNNLTSYNVTQGGDFLNHAVTLIDYHAVGTNGYYVKMRPNFYTINSEISQTYIEVTYTIDGYGLKIDYKYTSYRTDGQYDGSGFDAGHAPICFLVNNLTKYKSYTGDSPWTRPNKYDNEDGILPNESPGQSTSGTPLTKYSKEKWSLVYNPDNSKTIGVYANTTETENSFSLKQKEINDGNGTRVGGEFSGGYTILGRNYDLVPLLSTFDRSNFTKTISSYLIITPSPSTFIDTVYQIAGH